MQKTVIIFLVFCLVCDKCFSQQYPFVHYTPKDGLVNNRARFMFQDRKGLLYIATFGGLSVYDGSRFTNYTTNDGLSTNMIDDIIEMGDDSIWIIPNTSKINCLVKGRIKEVKTSDGFYPGIDKMIKGSDGYYYAAASEGLFRLEKNHFSRITLTDDSGRNVNGFFSDISEIKNKIFLITDPNMQPVAGPGRLIVYDFKNNKTAVSKSVFIYQVILSPLGEIFVSTFSGVKKLDETALEQNQIRLVDLPPPYQAVGKISGSYIYFDRQKNFWFGTSKGLIRIDSVGELKLFTVENGLSVNYQTSVFQDKENTIWLTNEQTGISKLTNLNLEFYSQITPGFLTHDIYADTHTDSVWFLDAANNRLLMRYGNSSTEYQLGTNMLTPPARSFLWQKNKNYLVDLFNIYECNLSARNKNSLTSLYGDTAHNTNNPLYCIPDGFGNLVGCNEKIVVLVQNKKIITYPLGYFADQLSLTNDGRLWVITRTNKLFQFRIHPENPDHYLELLRIYSKELPVIGPRSIAADKKGNVWIGTREQGLFCLFFNDDFSLRSWSRVTTEKGLSDNFISYLHVDENNNVWACSTGGLDKIELKNGKILVENITLGNNLYQHFAKIVTTRNGVHWGLSQSGIIRIIPGETLANDFQPKIIFREIREGANRVDQSTTPASFSHEENNISFSVAAPSFIDEKQIRFSYLLEGGGSKNWSDSSSQGNINFVNLSPGKYSLRAKAIFINHRYPDSEISYSFTIHPPWWQTWWFRTIISILFVVIIWLIIRSYYKRKLYQQRMFLEKQQAIEKERTRIAADMHDDLGSGLSTIRFLGEKVKRNVFSDVTREDIEKMQLTSIELIDKMNEIIWTMNEKNDSLENLVYYTRTYALEYCAENYLDCTIHLPENIPAIPVSGETRRNIFLTVKESLHNIVKHAEANNVEITVGVSKNLDITIRDNGKGLEKNDDSEEGNGLRNMQKRIESIGGRITIQNESGVTVLLKIPLA